MVSRNPWISEYTPTHHHLSTNSSTHQLSLTNHRLIIDFHQLITGLITNSSSIYHRRIMTINVQRLITDSSLTHHDHRFSLTNHLLIINASPIFTDLSLICTKSSPTHHWFITDNIYNKKFCSLKSFKFRKSAKKSEKLRKSPILLFSNNRPNNRPKNK